MNKSEARRKLKKDRELAGLCVYCGKYPPKEKFKGCVSCLNKKVKTTVKFCKNNKETTTQYRLLVKHQVIEKYGSKCNCCGETQVLFLTIDHKNNDGYIQRINEYGIKNPATLSWYLRLRKEPIREDLQVLCFNCNLGKSLNYGVCPHEELKRVLAPVYDRRHDPQFDKRLKIVWPPDDELIKMCNEISVSQVAKILGVDFTAVSGRLKRRNKYHLVIKKSFKMRLLDQLDKLGHLKEIYKDGTREEENKTTIS